MELKLIQKLLVPHSLILRLLVPFLAGAVMVLALPPYDLWPALWIGFSAFYLILLWTQTKQRAFWAGWMFGFGYFVFGLSWIANALLVDGSTYSWVIPLAIAGLPALLATFTGLASLACRILIDMTKPGGFFAFCGMIAMAEWTRGHIFTGFPWNLYGYGWSGVDVMAQSVSLFGVYGLTLLTIVWAALPGFLMIWTTPPRWKALLSFALYGLMAGLVFWGHARLNDNPTQFDDRLTLRIVQPSIPQSMKWDQQKASESFRLIAGLSKNDGTVSGKTVLVIWPETAVTQAIMDDEMAQAELRDIFNQYPGQLFLATGLLRWEESARKTDYYNSIGIYDNAMNRIATYDKSHLVPFGEYIPFSRWLPANPFVAPDGFGSGDGPTVLGLPIKGGHIFRLSPMICYEVIFPSAVVKRGSKPDLILNVTNDGWYGISNGPRQHVEITRFRAIEEGLPVARAANTGVSAVIDPYGRYIWKAQLMKLTASNVPLPKPAPVPTLYSKTGDLTMLCLAGFFILAALRKRFL